MSGNAAVATTSKAAMGRCSTSVRRPASSRPPDLGGGSSGQLPGDVGVETQLRYGEGAWRGQVTVATVHPTTPAELCFGRSGSSDLLAHLVESRPWPRSALAVAGTSRPRSALVDAHDGLHLPPGQITARVRGSQSRECITASPSTAAEIATRGVALVSRITASTPSASRTWRMASRMSVPETLSHRVFPSLSVPTAASGARACCPELRCRPVLSAWALQSAGTLASQDGALAPPAYRGWPAIPGGCRLCELGRQRSAA